MMTEHSTPPGAPDNLATGATPRPQEIAIRVPARVFMGMYLAAWARAERCPLDIIGGQLELHRRVEPSFELEAALAVCATDVIGVLGFAVPLMLDGRLRAFAASWPMTLGSSGKGSRS